MTFLDLFFRFYFYCAIKKGEQKEVRAFSCTQQMNTLKQVEKNFLYMQNEWEANVLHYLSIHRYHVFTCCWWVVIEFFKYFNTSVLTTVIYHQSGFSTYCTVCVTQVYCEVHYFSQWDSWCVILLQIFTVIKIPRYLTVTSFSFRSGCAGFRADIDGCCGNSLIITSFWQDECIIKGN